MPPPPTNKGLLEKVRQPPWSLNKDVNFIDFQARFVRFPRPQDRSWDTPPLNAICVSLELGASDNRCIKNMTISDN